jgi:hypothetical protein
VAIKDRVEEVDMEAAVATHKGGGDTEVFCSVLRRRRLSGI